MGPSPLLQDLHVLLSHGGREALGAGLPPSGVGEEPMILGQEWVLGSLGGPCELAPGFWWVFCWDLEEDRPQRGAGLGAEARGSLRPLGRPLAVNTRVKVTPQVLSPPCLEKLYPDSRASGHSFWGV